MILFWLMGCGEASEKQVDSSEQDSVIPLAPPAEGEGFQLSMEATVAPYSEAWICSVYPLPTSEVASVNWVEYQQTPGTHHMTLSTPGLIPGLVEPGEYQCEELLGSLMEDQIMFFGAQGAAQDTMYLPDGVAAQFPPGLDIIHEIHYVNTTDQPVDLYARVNAYTIDSDDVVEGIWGGQVRDEHINIPASSDHTEWTRCVMNEDVDVLFLASHTHKLGIEFTIRLFDGENSGEVFYTNTDWHDPKIEQYDPPLTIPAGQGFEYSCTWRNPNSEPINYGSTADDEMCNLAIVHMPYSMSAKCEVVETSDGVLWE